MNVLVTGAASPLGRALIRALIDDGRVDAVVAAAAGEIGVSSPKLTTVRAELSRSRAVRRLLFGPAREVHAIVHHQPLASRAHSPHVEATRELLHLAERHPHVRRFIYRSFAEMYRVRAEGGGIIGEEHPLDLSVRLPDGVRGRAEADLTVCTRMGMAPTLSIAVLRFAELLAPESGSQLYDYLSSRVCFRPLGFDPMIQLIGIEDAVRAIVLALFADAQGVFNVPGADVLPLSRVIALAGRRGIAVPGPLLGPLYAARSHVRGTEFRYQANRFRFHYSAVLDGRRAERDLGFTPTSRICWPELFAA